MPIEVRKNDGVVFAAINMRRIEARNAEELSTRLVEAFKGTNAAILDFSRVDFIDSTGMKALMTVLLHCRRDDVTCVLHNVSEDIMGVFVITRLNRLLPIEAGEQQALERVRAILCETGKAPGIA